MDMAEPNNTAAAGGGGGAAATPDQSPYCGGGGDHSNNKVYKGVRKRKWGKWVSEIRLPNSRERIWLGSYDSAEKAARAFDAALYCLRGCHANFNFPDTPLNLDINAGQQPLTSQEIQVIAAKFANNQEPSSSQSRQGHGGDNNNSSIGLLESKPKSDSVTESIYTATTTASSSSTVHECDWSVQVDHGDNIGHEMDWSTFLNDLGDSSVVGSDQYQFGLYSDPDKMHSGELLMYSTTPFEDNNVHEIEGDDPFSNQPLLWNW